MYLEKEVISQPSCELAALWNPILREEKVQIIWERKPKIKEQVGSTERRKRGREMEEETAEMERGKKAKIQGQTVARVRATEHKYNLRTARRRPSRYTLKMGTAISVSKTSLVFKLF
jgi:hypothetical protein